MKPFEVQTDNSGESLVLKFSGFLNENAEFEQIPEVTSAAVILNLESLEGTNSLGLKKWINWITPMAQKVQITIEKAPPEVVQQMSILRGFVPEGAKVSSIFVPYYCDSCGNEENVLICDGEGFFTGTSDTQPGYTLEEDRPCGQCGDKMQADILPDSFFKFLFLK